MTGYLTRRLLMLIPVLLGTTLLTFSISHLVPADPIRAVIGEQASADQVAAARHRLGLDGSAPEQYVRYVKNLLHGDLGTSIRTHRPVGADLQAFFPATLELSLVVVVLLLLISFPLGVLSAVLKDRWQDYAIRGLAVGGSAFPVFWIGLIFQFFLYGKLGWLPAGGRITGTLGAPPTVTGMYTVDSLLHGDLHRFLDAFLHLVLPALTLLLASMSLFVRSVRSSLLETLHNDFVRTARAKGLSETVVSLRHALPNALIPVLTVFGLYLSVLLGRAVFVEVVFSFPGIGWYALNSASSLDFPAIMGVTTLAVIVVVVVNLLTDVAYAAVDPRIRYG